MTEAVAVALGLLYVVLAAAGSRWCWPAGGLSAALLAWVSWRAHLPMQALLQLWYVAMALYGWRRWSAPETARIGFWSWRAHALAVGAALLASVPLARLLAGELQSAWPYLDTSTTLLSLVATWLTARMRLENWIYWIVIDAVLVGLYAAQGLRATAGLFIVYLVVCVIGLRTWSRRYRSQTSPA